MGRANMTNVNINGRIRQFIFLLFIAVLGMIVSSAFLDGKFHKSKTKESAQGIKASFNK